MTDDFWGPPSILDAIRGGPRRSYWSTDPEYRPDYQELETIQPRKVERFSNGMRVTTYRANGKVETVDEIIYSMEGKW